MFFYQGFSCPVCGKPFAEGDDVVACPTCGAPHHRHCWQKIGRCYYEEDHGTDRQWSRDKAQSVDTAPDTSSSSAESGEPCPYCGHKNPIFAEFCAHCGEDIDAEDWESAATPPPPVNQSPYGEYSPFRVADPYGGVSPDEIIGENRASDLAAFVGPNAAYYLPRFQKFEDRGTKCSWNWAAFLIPSQWLLYRKQYVFGIIAMVLEMLVTIVNGTIIHGALDLPLTFGPNALSYALENAGANTTLYMMALLISSGIYLLLHLLLGLAGNWLYYRTAERRIRKLQENADGVATKDIAAVGSISLVLGILPYVMFEATNLVVQLLFLQ